MSTIEAADSIAIERRIADLGRIDPEMAASYQGLVEQLDHDGLLDARRALMVRNALAGAIAAYYAAPRPLDV